MPTPSEPALGVSVRGLGKRYKIVRPRTSRRFGPFAREPREILWALSDVTFDVPRGSILGVIGRNGSGKTTLLKILSKVTPPTTGRVVLAGRMGSLLEVGTGFHPELTGRENVFMNGAILGMRRREIVAKFDEIVEFSDVGEFIDTPVKRYSSGMTLRLAFSVAAHLEPEILLVDEVLAVGDAAFQAKSVGKMGEVTSEGRTVVIVSHNMPTIASLADSCLWLDGGKVATLGDAPSVIRTYLDAMGVLATGDESALAERTRAPGHELKVRFASVRLLDEKGVSRTTFYEGEAIEVEVQFDVQTPAKLLEVRAYVKTVEGFWLFSSLMKKRDVDLAAGRWVTRTEIKPNPLRPGEYTLDLGLQTAVPQDFLDDAIRFSIDHSPGGYDNPIYRGPTGAVRLDAAWTEPERLA